jgi:hypothetical protein
MAIERTTDTGPVLTPEQQILGILAAEDGDNPEPVGDVADDTTEAPVEPEVEEDTSEEPADEADDDEDADTDEDEKDEEDDEEPETNLYQVKVDGEELTVTLDELKAGYSRQRDYTRKTQELSQQRRALEQEQQQAQQAQQQFMQLAQQAQQQIAMTAQQEPDWDALYRDKPLEAPRIEREWKIQQERRQVLAQQYQQAALQQQQRQVLEQVRESQQRLPDEIPDWKDPEIAKKERAALRDMLLDTGFDENQVAQIYDWRVVVLLRDALKYRQAEKRKQELRPVTEKKDAPKTVRPRAAKTPVENQRTGTQVQRRRLAQTGRVEDAAALIESMI